MLTLPEAQFWWLMITTPFATVLDAAASVKIRKSAQPFTRWMPCIERKFLQS